MNKYEAMIIFRESLKDTDWDDAVAAVNPRRMSVSHRVTNTPLQPAWTMGTGTPFLFTTSAGSLIKVWL